LRSCIISRATDGLEGVFFDTNREGITEYERGTRVFGILGVEVSDAGAIWAERVVITTWCLTLLIDSVGTVQAELSPEIVFVGALTSDGSEDGGSSPMLGFSGVRKGDLNGFWSVLVASSSRRRFACGVDILAIEAAFVLPIMSATTVWVLGSEHGRAAMSSVAFCDAFLGRRGFTLSREGAKKVGTRYMDLACVHVGRGRVQEALMIVPRLSLLKLITMDIFSYWIERCETKASFYAF
jgi:hypothetical protein